MPPGMGAGCTDPRGRLYSRLGARRGAAGRLRILLAEILNNTSEHAFAPEAGPAIEGRVTLTIRMEDGHLALRITDTGATMPGGCAPGRPAPMDLTGPDLPEGGFGWGLIHDLSCDIAYARAGPLNILTLCMPL